MQYGQSLRVMHLSAFPIDSRDYVPSAQSSDRDCLKSSLRSPLTIPETEQQTITTTVNIHSYKIAFNMIIETTYSSLTSIYKNNKNTQLYICWAQSMDLCNPWIALCKPWIRTLHGQSMDCVPIAYAYISIAHASR